MIKNIFFEQVKSFKTEQSSVGTLFQSNLKHQQSLENYHRTQKHDQKQIIFEKVKSLRQNRVRSDLVSIELKHITTHRELGSFKTEQSSVGNLFQSNLKHQQSLENYHRTQKHDQKQIFFETSHIIKTKQSSLGSLF